MFISRVLLSCLCWSLVGSAINVTNQLWPERLPQHWVVNMQHSVRLCGSWEGFIALRLLQISVIRNYFMEVLPCGGIAFFFFFGGKHNFKIELKRKKMKCRDVVRYLINQLPALAACLTCAVQSLSRPSNVHRCKPFSSGQPCCKDCTWMACRASGERVRVSSLSSIAT